MTRLSQFFSRERGLILIDADVTGPAGTTDVRLVLDTGAAATTLTPRVVAKLGYDRRDAFRRARVTSAVGAETGYWLHVAEFTALGISTPTFAVTVFPLGDESIDGLLGMNFLRYFNFEIRPAERRILSELIAP
jgi:predicted aspartyl protease